MDLAFLTCALMINFALNCLLLFSTMGSDKAAADANAAAWAAYYAQYGQQPQAPMTPSSGAPGTTQSNGQGNGHPRSVKCLLADD